MRVPACGRASASLVGLTVLLAASAANAQYASDFEPETYGPFPLTNGFGGGGQDGWYNPVAGSNDWTVYNYVGNPQGVVQNPQGSTQFAYGALVTNLGRAQHTATILGTNSYTLTFDQCVLPWNGAPPEVAQNNIASFSLQPSATARSFQTLSIWQDVNNPAAGWQQAIGAVDNAGSGAHAVSFFTVGAAWQNLQTNHWYRFSETFDMGGNMLTSASVTDLHTNAITTVNLVGAGLFLTGGSGNVLGYTLPTDLRMFAGGGSGAPTSAGNRIGMDNVNLSIVPAPGAAGLLGLGLLAASRRRRS